MDSSSANPVLPDRPLGDIAWEGLLDWLDSDEQLDPAVRAAFIARAKELRTRMQGVFVEIQRRILRYAAYDVAFEEEFRREMRENLPFMDASERALTLRALHDTTEDSLKRLVEQLAGLDLFNSVEMSFQTLTDTKSTPALIDFAQKLPANRRQVLLNMLQTLQKAIHDQTTAEAGTTEPVAVEAPQLPPAGPA